MKSALLLPIILFFAIISFAQVSGNLNEKEYDISKKVNSSRNSKSAIKLIDLENGSYLAIQNRKGIQEYLIVIDSNKNIVAKGVSSDNSNSPVVMSVGFCTVTIYKSSGGPKVTIGISKVTARVKCS
ncbi:hypothetical protein [Flavihumibacter sp.]|uniref:hypothetical protein n=1 Tax=Flavihumibacter sp. TaxID=1913981 RepID=UPI002FC72FD9